MSTPTLLPAGNSQVIENSPIDARAMRGPLPPLRPATKFQGRIGTVTRTIGSGVEWLIGALTLVVGLAGLATVPVLNLLSLGYLLEMSGRVARTGRVSAGLLGIRKAARFGTVVLGTWLVLLPVRFVSEMWASARLIDRDSRITEGLRILLICLAVVTVLHIVWAWWRGGRLRHFFWPAPCAFLRWVSQSGKFVMARDAVWKVVIALRLPHYFWLGLRGFVGALVWLIVPITIIAAASNLPSSLAALASVAGGLGLAGVLLYLPFLQAQFAAENRMRAMFEVSQVRELFRRAPVAFWLALVASLAFAVPLYLLKIELTPRDVTWLPSVVFVLFIIPARLLSGWAIGRARGHDRPRFFLCRWLARLMALPVVGLYVLIVYFTQYTSWYGVYSLYEQHAFLVPAPFLSLP